MPLQPYYLLLLFLLPVGTAYAQSGELAESTVQGAGDGFEFSVSFDAQLLVSEAHVTVPGHNGGNPVDVSNARLSTYKDGGFTMTETGVAGYLINARYLGEGEYSIMVFASVFENTKKHSGSDKRITQATFAGNLTAAEIMPDASRMQDTPKLNNAETTLAVEPKEIKVLGYVPHSVYTTKSTGFNVQISDPKINKIDDIDSKSGRVSNVSISGRITNPEGVTTRTFSGSTQYSGYYEYSWIVPLSAPRNGPWMVHVDATKHYEDQTASATWEREFYVKESDNPSRVPLELLLANATSNRTIHLTFNNHLRESSLQVSDFDVTNSSSPAHNVTLHNVTYVAPYYAILNLNQTYFNSTANATYPNLLASSINYTVFITDELEDVFASIIKQGSNVTVNTTSIP